jgi:hypothetical protein
LSWGLRQWIRFFCSSSETVADAWERATLVRSCTSFTERGAVDFRNASRVTCRLFPRFSHAYLIQSIALISLAFKLAINIKKVKNKLRIHYETGDMEHVS